MGKWSAEVAKIFLTWLGSDNDIHQKKWIDIGCGTGVLTIEICETYNPISVLGIDPSSEYLPQKSTKIVDFKIGDCNQLPVEHSSFDLAVSGLSLNFTPDKNTCIQEMLRVLKPGGNIALYVWDYSDQMEFLRYFWDAAIEVRPEANALDEGIVFPICKKPALLKLFEDNHLNNIKLNEIVIETKFANFQNFWDPFLGGQGPAGNFLLSLNQSDRNLLKTTLKAKIEHLNQEEIILKAKAFAIQGRKTGSE